jgi:hypothetical protein
MEGGKAGRRRQRPRGGEEQSPPTAAAKPDSNGQTALRANRPEARTGAPARAHLPPARTATDPPTRIRTEQRAAANRPEYGPHGQGTSPRTPAIVDFWRKSGQPPPDFQRCYCLRINGLIFHQVG